jgi:hypothetical protein
LTFEDEELNETLSTDKEPFKEIKLNYEDKRNSTIETDSNISSYEEDDNNKNHKEYQSNCSDGSNLIDNSKNVNIGNNNHKIKPQLYISKSKSEKLYEATMEKTFNFMEKAKSLITKNKH